MYIAVYGSSIIEVTDLSGKSIKQIKSSGDALLPRFFTANEGKVYVSLYDGYVARLDTASLEIEQKVKVGRNPEQLVVANNKLYVANSGGLDYNTPVGYDKTVSVIDLASFQETKKIEVVTNPVNLVTDSQGDVYWFLWVITVLFRILSNVSIARRMKSRLLQKRMRQKWLLSAISFT